MKKIISKLQFNNLYLNNFLIQTLHFSISELVNLNIIWSSYYRYCSFFNYYKPSLWMLVSFEYVDIDVFLSILVQYKHKKNNETLFNSNTNIKIESTAQLFYKSFFEVFYQYYIKNAYNFVKNYIAVIFNILIFNVKWTLLAFIISFVYFFFSLFYIQVEFTKQVAVWYVLLLIFYLLMSTFNNFLNKYKYGKFTSAIQRFWKRTGMVFWLIEGFLFMLFFYYFLNSSQEPLYMFDYSSLNQELLIQLKTSYRNMILLSLAIYLSFILILNSNFLNYYQNILLLSLISLIVFYMLFIETYQFAYIISLFSEKNWLFDESNQIWSLEFEQNNLRVKQQYFILCLIAKYWHFIFIFISWFFFLIKCLEINKINYNMLGYNTQNLIILYMLNLFCLIQWFKYLFKKFLEVTYYWFHIQYDEKFFTLLNNEILNTLYSLFNLNLSSVVYNNYKIISNVLYCSNELNLWKYVID